MDAVRLTLVFAGPPEDDIDWADMSPAGSLQFLQRAWRLSGDVTSRARARPAGRRRPRPAQGRPTRRVHEVAELLEAHRFNVVSRGPWSWSTPPARRSTPAAAPADPAVREAAEAVAMLLSLVAPYTAEEMWERLGHQPTVARAGWPEVDPALLVEDSVTARGAGPGQGPRPAGGLAGDLRGRPGGAGAGRPRGREGGRRAAGAQGLNHEPHLRTSRRA